ncbi:DUF5819 family protein [Georgenia sp. MJ206]|uniref:DUF5819 family protein n=1 Tax=Georgenia wangjunii TaxID=3117730 RepID=UPI002F26C081
MAEKPPATTARARAVAVPRYARVVVWPLLALVLVHALIVATWVAPDNAIRQTIGAERVRSYVMPVFEQNWSIFAPTPRRVAVDLEFRARLVDPVSGDPRDTGWVDVVDGEDSLVLHNLAPPRMSLAGRRLAGRINTSVRAMNDVQRDHLDGNYLTTPVTGLRDRLLAVESDGAAGPQAIETYMRNDLMTTEFLTLYAGALYDAEVTHVQYRTGRRHVPAFEDRAERSIEDVEPSVEQYGWRPSPDVSPESLALFAPYVAKSVGER